MPYDPNNIFARIIRGEIPSHKIYEDDYVLAFMDVMPQVDGHCLVVPKQGSRTLIDASPDVLSRTIVAVQAVAQATIKAFDADGFQVRQYNELAGGQTVFHLHFHILPVKEGADLKPHVGTIADPERLKKHAQMIRAALQS
jgi:histidine triad (HIT) family protein